MKHIITFLLALTIWATFATGSQSSIDAVPTHIYSTLFTAQDVNKYLSNDADIDKYLNWCRDHGISKVYLEAYRSKTLVQKSILLNAKAKFLAAGFLVSSCVATTEIGKPSTGWNLVNCYTNSSTQQQLTDIFQYAAALFDEIIIDDFYFTDCECSECLAARAAKRVTVGPHQVSFQETTDLSCLVPSECTWKDYRRTLMAEVSKYLVLEASKKVNPKVKIIIKYPNWYDVYQDFGYDTFVESNMFDMIWVGTESRDYADPIWGGRPQYFGFFNMRWLSSLGGPRTGGGWYDWIATTPQTYIEQGRVTILGSAKESFLFCFSGIYGGPDIEALHANMPELIQVSEQVRSRNITGVAAYKPPSSHGGCVQDPLRGGGLDCPGEVDVFDFVGMLGIPIAPTHLFPDSDSKSAFFSIHSLKDPNLASQLTAYIASGKPILITDGLKSRLPKSVPVSQPNVHVLEVKDAPHLLLNNPPSNLQEIRDSLLKPLGFQFSAPVNVSLFPFQDGSWVVDNFNDYDVTASLNMQNIPVRGRGWTYKWN